MSERAKRAAKPSLKERWWRWHLENPHVWKAFEKFALEAVRAGKTRTSAWLVVNRIRWEMEIETKGSEEFRISNDFIALYARLFVHEHPEHEGLFVLKKMKRV